METNDQRSLNILYIIFFIAFCVLIISGITLNRAFQERSTTVDWVTHTYQVIDKFRQLYIEVIEAERQQQNYIANNNQSFLNLSLLSQTEIQTNLHLLKLLTSDNNNEQQRLNKLSTLLGQYSLTLKQSSNNYIKTKQPSLTDQEGLINQISSLIQDGINAEAALLQHRNIKMLDTRSVSKLIVRITALLSIIILLASFAFIFILNKRMLDQAKKMFKLEHEKLLLEHDKSVAMTAAAEDAAARKKLEEKNLIHDQYLQSIVNNTQDYAIFMLDPKGYIMSWNRGAEYIEGYKADDIIGKHFSIFYPKEKQEQKFPEKELQQAKKIGRFEDEGWRIRKDGSRFWASVIIYPLYDLNGQLLGFGKITRDLTERILYEQALKEEKNVLEKAMLTKDRFLASMSHEFRTPLNAIIGFTGILLKKLPGPLNIEQEKQLKIIKRSSVHLLSLINDLLDLAKIESGKIEITLEKVELCEFINEVTATLMPLISAKGLQFDVIIPKHEFIIATDKRVLTQILINLVNNAIKFTERGKITVKLDKRQFSNHHENLVIDVIDTGIGIKPEDQAKIFQIYQRLHDPNLQIEGTGLGLYLSQKLAQLIHCNIQFKSELGKGSQFSIVFELSDLSNAILDKKQQENTTLP